MGGYSEPCARFARSLLQMSRWLSPRRCPPPGGPFTSRGQALMGDSGFTLRVIRTADGLVRFRPRCVVRVSVSQRRRFREEGEEHCILLFCCCCCCFRSFFFPPSFKSPTRLSLSVYAACSRARKHRSDKVSPRVRMKERARQTEAKAK